MSLIANAFRKDDKTAALIPFITAGFPRPDATVDMLVALAGAGADIIEIGVPFSDPMADGPAIQCANAQALKNGVSLPMTLSFAAEFRRRNQTTPLVLMGYANSFVNAGRDSFARDAAAAGVNGVIIVDLADSDRPQWRTTLAARQLSLIPLIAPTTPPSRMRELAAHAEGFIYCISLRGVTGAANLDSAAVAAAVAEIRRYATAPIAVGFGVRSPDQAAAVGAVADGVVIGSRLAELAEDTPATATRAVSAFVGEAAAALRR